MGRNQSRANEGVSRPRTGEGLARKVAEDDVEGHSVSQPREGDSPPRAGEGAMRRAVEDDVEGQPR